MPETPHYYLMRGNKRNALDSLQYLHRNVSAIEREFKEIQDLIDDHHWRNESLEFEDMFRGHGNRKGE